MNTSYKFGDVLAVKPAPGRIERSRFVVTHSNKVFGGGWRYDGIFPGTPLLYGKVYSDDIICHLRAMPEPEAAALVAQ
mgnify:CR=1 FL=1